MTTFPSRKCKKYRFIFVKQHTVLRSIFGTTLACLNARQTTATGEGPIPNAGDAVWDRHARQTTAVFEGKRTNAGDTVGDRHARQTTATIEGPAPNAGDAVGDRVVATFPNRNVNQTSFVFVE